MCLLFQHCSARVSLDLPPRSSGSGGGDKKTARNERARDPTSEIVIRPCSIGESISPEFSSRKGGWRGGYLIDRKINFPRHCAPTNGSILTTRGKRAAREPSRRLTDRRTDPFGRGRSSKGAQSRVIQARSRYESKPRSL